MENNNWGQALWLILMVTSACTAVERETGTADGLSRRQPEAERQVDIAIRDHTYVMVKSEAIRIGTPMVITIRNEDAVTHGFVSSTFAGLLVRGEGEGITAWGHGVEEFHVDPGKTLTIHVIPQQLGTLSFHCDIHSGMKEKEIFYVDIRPSRHR